MAVVQPAIHLAAEMGDRAHVEEMHAAQHQHGEADLGAEEADRFGIAGRFLAQAERQGDEADIDEVEADDEQMVGRSGQLRIMAETLDQEDLAIFRQGARDPDGDGERDL